MSRKTNFAEWIRYTLRRGGRKIRILRYVLALTPENQMPRLLDVGSQFVRTAVNSLQSDSVARIL